MGSIRKIDKHTINGAAGTYEKNRRERKDVVSAMITSTSNITQVYPIYMISVHDRSIGRQVYIPGTTLLQLQTC